MADWFSNPKFKQFASEALQDFGYGLSNSTNFGNAFGAATQRMAQMQPYRDQQQMLQEQEAEDLEQTNATRSWLEHQGYTDLVPLVDAGHGSLAFQEALKRMQPGYGAGPSPIEVNGQLVHPVTGEVIGDYRDPNAGVPAAPSGYRWNPDGTQTYIPGGPADPSVQAVKPPTDAERRGGALSSVVDTDAALLLGDGTNPGVFERLADSGDQFWNMGAYGVNPLKGMASPGYQQAANAVENIAQSYLYAISGQAAPAAEVEKIVNSITPRPFEHPAVLAEKKRRLAEYVEAIRMSAGKHAPAASGDGWEVIGVQ